MSILNRIADEAKLIINNKAKEKWNSAICPEKEMLNLIDLYHILRNTTLSYLI